MHGGVRPLTLILFALHSTFCLCCQNLPLILLTLLQPHQPTHGGAEEAAQREDRASTSNHFLHIGGGGINLALLTLATMRCATLARQLMNVIHQLSPAIVVLQGKCDVHSEKRHWKVWVRV